ncbi:MAG: hypothetical protein ACTSR8_11965 [Promethearchaeota archaeon]
MPKESVRGILLQSIICLLDALDESDNWNTVSIEPEFIENQIDKVDILWTYDDKEKAVQVKSSINQLGLPDARRWIEELKSDYKNAKEYELILLGSCSKPLTDDAKNDSLGAKVTIKPIDIESLLKESTYNLLEFANKRGKGIQIDVGRTIVEALNTIFFVSTAKGMSLSKQEFENKIHEKINQFVPDKALINNHQLEALFNRLFILLFETKEEEINRAELLTLIKDEIGLKEFARILSLRGKDLSREGAAEVLSLSNDNWEIIIQSGFESGTPLNTLSIKHKDLGYFRYGKINQSRAPLEQFKEFILDQCKAKGLIIKLNDLFVSLNKENFCIEKKYQIRDIYDEIAFSSLFKLSNPNVRRFYRSINCVIELPLYIHNKGEIGYEDISLKISSISPSNTTIYTSTLGNIPEEWRKYIKDVIGYDILNAGAEIMIKVDWANKNKEMEFLKKQRRIGRGFLKTEPLSIKQNDDPIEKLFILPISEQMLSSNFFKEIVLEISFTHKNPGITRNQILTLFLE